jgi:hypothetical protein
LASSVAHRPHAARADSIISVIPSTAPPG